MRIFRPDGSKNWWFDVGCGGLRDRRSAKTTDRREAQLVAKRAYDELFRQTQLGERPRYTWKQASERWLREADKRTLHEDKHKIEWFGKHIEPHDPIDQVDHETIELLKSELLAEGRKKATVNRWLDLLRAILRKAAFKWKWLSVDDLPQFDRFKITGSVAQFLTKDEFVTLASELPAPLWRDVAMVAVGQGWRRDNVERLRWRWLNLAKRSYEIPAEFSKNGKPMRGPLTPITMEVLLRWRGKNREFVFCHGKKNKPIEWNLNARVLKEACKRAGIPVIRFHDLRHTWASWLVQAGAPLQVVQELGGWSDYRMVLIYAKFAQHHLEDWASKVKMPDINVTRQEAA